MKARRKDTGSEYVETEQLTSQVIRGSRHAIYPTALRSLCLLERDAWAQTERGFVPDCPTCVEVMRALNREYVKDPKFPTGIPRDWKPWLGLHSVRAGA